MPKMTVVTRVKVTNDDGTELLYKREKLLRVEAMYIQGAHSLSMLTKTLRDIASLIMANNDGALTAIMEVEND